MTWVWIGFIVFVLAGLVLDLVVLNRRSEEISVRSSLRFVALFVFLALAFNVGVYFMYERDWMGAGSRFKDQARCLEVDRLVAAGKLTPESAVAWTPPPDSAAAEAMSAPGRTAALQFLSGWMTEYSLSVDNLFVIALIFAHFKVPARHQRRVLFWGILGALVFRGLMIWGGTELIDRFHWLIYAFGAFLVITAIKLAFAGDADDKDIEHSATVRLARRLFPVSSGYDGQKFFTRVPSGALVATPLFLVLVVVELTDVVFAVDSIPAIIGITRDPFLIFTSNVFAILGLRSLYFALAGLMDKFHYLKYSLAVILGFVGVKMLLEMPWIHFEIPTVWSLGVIGAALAMGIIASLIHAGRAPAPGTAGLETPADPERGGP